MDDTGPALLSLASSSIVALAFLKRARKSKKRAAQRNKAMDKACYEGARNGLGQRHGVGKFRFDNGDVYEGQWQHDQMTGTGKYVWSPNGPVTTRDGRYEGQFVNGKKVGLGKFMFADGNVYEGQYKDNKRDGSGTFTWPNGTNYSGGWKSDKKHGHGVYRWANGDVYEGQYFDHLQHGRGEYTDHEGEKYIGQWEAGKKHGEGRYIHDNGETYKGQWESDFKQGRGTMTSEFGQVASGVWYRDWKTLPLQINGKSVRCCHAAWSSDKNGFSDKPLVRTQPALADADLRNASAIKGSVAVIVRGKVAFADKVKRALAAGAVGVIVINNEMDEPDELFGMSSEEGFDIPVVSVSVATGGEINEGDKCSCLCASS